MASSSTTPATDSSGFDARRIKWLFLLGHPERFRIIDFLAERGEEVRVTDIYRALGMQQAIASQHLITLRDRGVLTSRPVGTSRLYTLAHPQIAELLNAVRPYVMANGNDDSASAGKGKAKK